MTQNEWRNEKATEYAKSVTRWTVPPECQGQIVEHAYGYDEDGALVRRVTDRSDGSVAYAWRESTDHDDPINREPK